MAAVEFSNHVSVSLSPQNTRLVEGQFLPDQKHGPLEKLLYLTRFSNESKLCPFTELQEKTFVESKKTTTCAYRCLKNGIWATTLLAVIPTVVIGVPVISIWSQSSTTNALYLAVAFSVVTATVNLFNFLATGTCPDRSARANANLEYQIQKTTQSYDDMGCFLIELNAENPELAQSIATKLDIEKIKNEMKDFLSDEMAEDHCTFLKHAKWAIEKGTLRADAPRSIRQTFNLYFPKVRHRRDNGLQHRRQ